MCMCVCSQLTFNLGVQVVDDDLELAQRHVSQVGGLQAPLHQTLADVRHVWQLKKEQTNEELGNAAVFVVIMQSRMKLDFFLMKVVRNFANNMLFKMNYDRNSAVPSRHFPWI